MQTHFTQYHRRHLDDDVREVDLPSSALRTWNQVSDSTTLHSARTLVKQPGLKVVLLTLDRGARIPEHHADGDITVQVLSGRVQTHVANTELELPRGRLIAIAAGLPHDVIALESSELLLTIATP